MLVYLVVRCIVNLWQLVDKIDKIDRKNEVDRIQLNILEIGVLIEVGYWWFIVVCRIF